MIRTSAIAKEIAKQFGIAPAQALFFVQAAKKELEITTTSLLTEKQASEIELMVSQSLRAK